jgi:multiple sugar transport system permease protein
MVSKSRVNTGLIFVLPSLVIIGIVMLYPLGYTLCLGFFKKTLLKPIPVFVGFSQYAKLFADPVFINAIVNTFVWTIGSVTFQFLLGFAIALLLHQDFVKYKTIWRIFLMIPWVLPSIIGAADWKWMFNGDYGIINYIFTALHIIPAYKTWLSNTDTAMATVIFVNVWKMFPYVLLMIEAALQGVSKEVKEAAVIDGSNTFTTFKVAIWPVIAPTCYSLILLLTIWTLNAFTFVYALTEGGPAHSTEVLALYINIKAFQNLDFGLASGASTVLFVLSFLTGLLYLRMSKEEN